MFTSKLRFLICLLAIFQLMITVPLFSAGEFDFAVTDRTLHRAEKHYGVSARKRLLAWQDLMRLQEDDDLVKLKKVNNFFNEIKFIDDLSHWGKDDYWATPTEFLASGGGDCEDFAIAKYFTLIILGIAEQQLTLTYVTALRLNMPHMVLTYYPAPDLEPIILDNLINTIEPSSKRTDLFPVYSFNTSDLWAAKIRGQGERLGIASRIRPWRELLIKMKQDMPKKEDVP
ncbi:MAG: transglutaminase-like cysteine peptidase [Desulforhopalus sp.]